MRASDIRQQFISYFEPLRRIIRSSASLVSADGRGLRFVHTGVVPFNRPWLVPAIIASIHE